MKVLHNTQYSVVQYVLMYDYATTSSSGNILQWCLTAISRTYGLRQTRKLVTHRLLTINQQSTKLLIADEDGHALKNNDW